MPDNALATYQPSQNRSLSTALSGLEAQLENAARQNVLANAGEGFTAAEIRAMTTIEELKLVNGLDLAAVIMRGKLLRQIEEEALWTVHPERYDTFEAMARSQGISVSELSNVRDLCFVIFPYFEETLGVQVAQVWENIGKSNMRELVPVLKAIITGQPSASANVNRSADNELDNVITDFRSAGEEIDMEEDGHRVRRTAVERLLEAGQLTNTQLRARIRPERTAALEPTVVNRGETRVVVMTLSEDQYTLLNRRLQGYMDPIIVDLPEDANARRRMASNTPALRDLVNLIS